jgi:beta-mannosidase
VEKLWRYARPFLAEPEPDLESFVSASQRAQSEGLKIGIEHYRRRKAGGGGGVLVWQLNEPWPAISWALVDHGRQPKPAYETVRQLYNPLLVSVEYPAKRYRPGDRFCARLWIVNDEPGDYPGCQVEAVLWDREGQQVERFTHTTDVAADSAQVVGSLQWNLPPGGDWRLTCRLLRGGQTLAENEYELAAFDDLRPTWKQSLRNRLRGLVIPD